MEKIIFRNIDEKDIRQIWKWRNKENIRNAMYSSEKISWESHQNWYSNIKNCSEVKVKMFGYYKNMGIVNISEISTKHKRCHWGFYIGVEKAPQGMGLLMGYTALNYIFEELNIEKVIGEVLKSNFISQKFHIKLGFKHEGTLRNHIFKNNGYEHVLTYGLLKEEWLESRSTIKEHISNIFGEQVWQ